jgi:hypothetical protein
VTSYPSASEEPPEAAHPAPAAAVPEILTYAPYLALAYAADAQPVTKPPTVWKVSLLSRPNGWAGVRPGAHQRREEQLRRKATRHFTSRDASPRRPHPCPPIRGANSPQVGLCVCVAPGQRPAAATRAVAGPRPMLFPARSSAGCQSVSGDASALLDSGGRADEHRLLIAGRDGPRAHVTSLA